MTNIGKLKSYMWRRNGIKSLLLREQNKMREDLDMVGFDNSFEGLCFIKGKQRNREETKEEHEITKGLLFLIDFLKAVLSSE